MMKTQLFSLIFLLSGAGGLCGQQRIEALIDRAEQAPNVDMNVVINRNRKSGAVERTVKTVTIRDNRKLVVDFASAFEQERANAYLISENTNNGRQYKHYRFHSDDREITSTFQIENDSKATVGYTNRNADVPPTQFLLDEMASARLDALREELEKKMEEARRDDAVQVGHGVVRRTNSTLPKSEIDVEAIVRQGANNLIDVLRNRIPGLDIYDGEEGNASIRGLSSLSASNEPLVLVEGMRWGTIREVSDVLNIHQVKTIRIVQDGWMHDPQGANGVILITLK